MEACRRLLTKMEIKVTNFRERIHALFFDKSALNQVAGMVRDDIHSWYASLPEDWFDNTSPFPDGTPRHEGKRTFMAPLSTAWKYETHNNEFSVYFAKHRPEGGNWGLRLQQYGGEIRPVKKRALTIPVTAEARGLSARAYQAKTGHDLFVVKGEAAKKNPDIVGSLVWEDPEGDLHAAYVLRKRSEVPPLKKRRGHDAIPTDDQLTKWAVRAYNNFLKYSDYGRP